ncbi:hypothetical protein J2S19_000876 [Metabacillus malikii]|uniref:Uncharacterized protein n=1 Tax=Metabacillus malikii TaxID=1504265 RepID=A0ABT9ZCH2_9BACI|nr:hypothetical protein [Metabacillus malikii]
MRGRGETPQALRRGGSPPTPRKASTAAKINFNRH